MTNEQFYRFKLGDFECVCISDGGHDYPLENFFANVQTEQVEEVLRQRNLPTDHIWTPYTYLFVDTGEHRILVDTGAGKVFSTTGKLLQSMKAAGIAPTDIDMVVFTHAHGDHIGGVFDEQGQMVFTNARYFIWKDEWDFWFSDMAFEKTPKKFAERFVALARKVLTPLQDRVTLLQDESDILPGIHAITTPGHTPGHIAVSFSSGNEQLLYTGDTVLYPLHLEYLDWLPIYDILPDKAASSKRKLFDYAARENAWVVGQHFPPFPSLGHIVKKGEGWQWQPIEMVG